MLDIKEYFLLFWIMFLLILVQDADGDMPQSLYPKLVTVPEVGMCCWWRLCCKWSDAGFVLKLDVEMLLLVDAWEVVIRMSPNSNFHQLSVYISSAVSCYRNLHQGFSGFALFNSSSKWTFNVQELLTLRGSVGTGSTWFSLNRCVQVSSSSSLSHFQVWCSRVRTRNDLTSFQEF